MTRYVTRSPLELWWASLEATQEELAAARAAAWGAAWDAAWDAAWAAAWAAARAAAWDAAGAAAWAAARDAQLLALTEYVCAGLPLDERHRQRSRACWRVWQKGYGLYGEVDGVLVVYAAEART